MGKLIPSVALFASIACVSDRASARSVMKASEYTPKDGTLVTSLRTTHSPDGIIICRNERPTGSNMMERICRYQEDVDRLSARTQEMLDRMTPARPCRGDGCAASNIDGFNQ